MFDTSLLIRKDTLSSCVLEPLTFKHTCAAAQYGHDVRGMFFARSFDVNSLYCASEQQSLWQGCANRQDLLRPHCWPRPSIKYCVCCTPTYPLLTLLPKTFFFFCLALLENKTFFAPFLAENHDFPIMEQ